MIVSMSNSDFLWLQPMAMEQVLSDRDSEDEVDDDVADFEDRRVYLLSCPVLTSCVCDCFLLFFAL